MSEWENLPHYEAPANDNQLLLNLQYQYKTGEQRALVNMYAKLYEVAYKLINNRGKKNKYIREMSASERQKKAHDAATYIIEQYLKRADFAIKTSVTGYLYLRIQWELYGREHQAKRDSMLLYTDNVASKKTTDTAEIKYRYLVRNLKTGEVVSYESLAELYLNPEFKTLRKKRLVESIKTGKKWKKYKFDILEEYQ